MQSSSWYTSQLPQSPAPRRTSPVLWALLAGVIVVALVAAVSAVGQGGSLVCIAPFLSLVVLVGIMLATRGPGNRAGQGAVAGLLLGLFLSAGLFVGTFIYSFSPSYVTAEQNFQATQTVSAQQTAVVATPTPVTSTNGVTFNTYNAPLAGSYYLGDGLLGLIDSLFLAAVGAIIGGITMGRQTEIAGASIGMATASQDALAVAPPSAPMFPSPFTTPPLSSPSAFPSDLPGPPIFAPSAPQARVPYMRPYFGLRGESTQFGGWLFFSIFFFLLRIDAGFIVWGSVAILAGLFAIVRLQRFLARSETATGYLDTTLPMSTSSRFASGRVATFTTSDGRTWQLPLIRRQPAEGPLTIRYRLQPQPTALVENGAQMWIGIGWRILLGLASVGLGIWLQNGLSLPYGLFLPF